MLDAMLYAACVTACSSAVREAHAISDRELVGLHGKSPCLAHLSTVGARPLGRCGRMGHRLWQVLRSFELLGQGGVPSAVLWGPGVRLRLDSTPIGFSSSASTAGSSPPLALFCFFFVTDDGSSEAGRLPSSSPACT